MSAETPTQKLVRLESPSTIVVLGAMPQAAQIKINRPHIQIAVPVPGMDGAMGYTSVEGHLYRLSETERATVKLAMVKAQAGEAGNLTTSYSGSGEPYIPLTIDTTYPGVVKLQLAGVTVLTLIVNKDAAMPLNTSAHQPGTKGWTHGNETGPDVNETEVDEDEDEEDEDEDED